MVLKSGKCHFMCFGQNTVNEIFVYDNTDMKNHEEEKILGVILTINLGLKVMSKIYVKKLLKTSGLCHA